MIRSIDHRVQLLFYNKKEICQYAVCYLHVKSQNHVKMCKFYVVDSKFNPIIGVNNACCLGLLKFTEPVFENWTETVPIRSSELNIDAVRKVCHMTKFQMFQIFPRHLQESGSLIMLSINICFRALAVSNVTPSP